MLENAGATPVEFHTHCTTGLGPHCCLAALEGGMTIVNAALPPLSDGSSNPSVFDVAANASALGHESDLDLESLKPVSAHFETVAKRESFPVGRPVAFDAGQHRHQVPGGMISNLAFQLRKVGMEDRLADTLEETVRVRAELGYPVMVTPLSQFVGSQAAINVIAGERYREVTDQVIEYALGYYGETAVEAMDPRHPPAHPGAQAHRGGPARRRAGTHVGRSARALRRQGRHGRGHDAALAVRRRRPSRRSARPARPCPIRAAATRWSTSSTALRNATTEP